MKYEQEFTKLYEFNKRVSDIWNAHKEHFDGIYKIVNSFVKKEPIYRSDYIEPYDYRYDDYVVIENIETGKRQELKLTYFNQFFRLKLKETIKFSSSEYVANYIQENHLNFNYDVYRVGNVYELDIYE